jgi:hypothetical protein
MTSAELAVEPSVSSRVGWAKRVVEQYPMLLPTLAAGIAAFLIYELTRHAGRQAFNTYTLFANALLHGTIDIVNAPPWLDTIAIDGHHYSHQGPLPAVLMMPFVLVWGVGFEIRHFAALLGGGVGAATWLLATRLGLRGWIRLALWTVPVLGTTIWYEAKQGETWGIAAIASVLFLLLALCEYFGKRRPFAVGLLVGLAALCRPTACLALPGFALAFRRPRLVVQLALGAIGPGIVLVLFNFARYGTWADRSAEIAYPLDAYRLSRPPGLFSPAHLPFNLYSWFVMVPGFQAGFPYLRPTLLGTSITFTSPVLATAFASKRDRWLWLCALCVVLPPAFFYANGFAQFGMRYLLDTVPFLFALVCIAMRDNPTRLFYPLLVWSIAVNLFGVLYTNAFNLLP